MLKITSKNHLVVALLLLIITGCAQPITDPDQLYEIAKKQGVVIYPYRLSFSDFIPSLADMYPQMFSNSNSPCPNCLVYPTYHPGDWLMYETEYNREDYGLLIQGSWGKCFKQCKTVDACEYSSDFSCKGQFGNIDFDCMDKCLQKIYKSKSIASHIKGGYYSDGSYYATYSGNYIPIFLNIHPTRRNYKKSNWQKDRDDCMYKTSAAVQTGIYFRGSSYRLFEKGTTYYRDCLKERGYSLKGKIEQ